MKETLTTEQKQVFDGIIEFVTAGKQPAAVLKGYAGTGKTYVVSSVIRELERETGIRIQVAAPTHKALSVLRSKCDGLDVEFLTTASVLGKRPLKVGDEIVFVSNPNRRNMIEGGVLFVDESSMIGIRDFEDLLQYADELGTRIVFIGDPAQLPPVGESTSATFDVETCFRLETIVRQAADNPIIQMSMTVRTLQAENQLVSLDHVAGFANLSHVLVIGKERMHEFYMSALEHGLNVPILTYDNHSSIQHNNAIHKLLHPESSFYAQGEKLIANETFTIEDDDYVSNGEQFTIIASEPIEGTTELPLFSVTVSRDLFGTTHEWVLCVNDRKSKAFYAKCQKLSTKIQLKAAENAPPFYREMAVENFNHYRRLRDLYKDVAPLRHGYSMTIHKSQGSTFDGVLLDWNSIEKCKTPFDRSRLLYVAITRASKYLVIAC